MKYLLTLLLSLAAASAQVIPYFPPFLSSLPSAQARKEAAVTRKLKHDSRFSVLSSDRALISLVVQTAKARGFSVRTERAVIGGREFVRIYATQ